MGYFETVMDLIHDLVSAKNPNWSEKKTKDHTQLIFRTVRDHVKDLSKFRELVREIIEDDNQKFNIGIFSSRVKKSQGISPLAGEPEDFGFSGIQQYMLGFVGMSVRFNYQENLESERCQNELRRYSSFLANTPVIYYKDGDRKRRRYLTKKEYEYISQQRLMFGTGMLVGYEEVKIQHDDDVVEDTSEQFTRGAVPAVAAIVAGMTGGDYEPEF